MTTDRLLARLEAVEKRLQIVEDQEKIRECLARYGFNADLGRSEDWVNTWTEKGVYDLGPNSRHTGPDELMYNIIQGKGHKSIENHSQHTVCNLFIRVNGDTAWAEGYSVVFTLQGTEYKAWTNGYNHWEFEKRGDRWFMTLRYRRAVGMDEWGGKVIKAYLKE